MSAHNAPGNKFSSKRKLSKDLNEDLDEEFDAISRAINRRCCRNHLKEKRELQNDVEHQSNRNRVMNYLQDTLNNFKRSPLNPNDVSINNCVIVYFDLETTGFQKDAEIIQIAAKCNNDDFNIYIKPSKKISPNAAEKNKMSVVNGKLYVRMRKVDTTDITEALHLFSKFLKKRSQPALLVAHNTAFDVPKLLQAIFNNRMVYKFKMIVGFSDTLTMLKKKFPQRKGQLRAYKLSSLAETYLNVDDSEPFHSADYDVTILQSLIKTLNKENDLFENVSSLESAFIKLADSMKEENVAEFKNRVSDTIIKKLAKNGFTFDSMLDVYKNQGKERFLASLTRQGENRKPLITKDKKLLEKIVKIIEEYADCEVDSE